MSGKPYDPSEDKKMWKGMTFVFQGQFNSIDGKPMYHKALARLVRERGGEVQATVPKKEFRPKDTMIVLVTTIAEVKKHGGNVQRAVEIGKTYCAIVQFDYIVDTLFPTKRKDGKAKYTCAQSLEYHSIQKVLNRLRRRAEAKEIFDNQYYKEAKGNDHLVDSRLYHLYKDQTGFKYDVKITHEYEPDKVDKRNREKPAPEGKVGQKRIAKWTLKLFESNAKPVTYKFGATYHKPGQKNMHYTDNLDDADFCVKFKQFKQFFQKKTGINWDKRLDGIIVRSLENATKEGLSKDQGRTEADDKPVFKYTPPHSDQPHGEMPKDWKDHTKFLLEKEERAREKRLKKKEELRKREIEEEERLERELQKRQEEYAEMAREDEDESQPSDCGWDSVGESAEDDD